jgi:hypothetical protein
MEPECFDLWAMSHDDGVKSFGIMITNKYLNKKVSKINKYLNKKSLNEQVPSNNTTTTTTTKPLIPNKLG